MTPEQEALLWKIELFDIDGGECNLPFAVRLGRENGWSRVYAERTVTEYKRYVFLAMCSNVPRCPSEDVDAAWHLHLTYTRSYWKRFCGEVLGKPLHHEPTRGGRSEAEKHFAMYEATLAAYRKMFGNAPPTDIWPGVKQRFGDDVRQRKVNVVRNWIIPKQPVKKVILVTTGLLLAAVVLPGCDGGLNPFALKGAEFFYVLIPSMIVAIVLGRMLRSAVQGPAPYPSDDEASLTWEQAAYLAGGYPRLTSAAIARLAEDNVIRIDGDRLEAGKLAPINRAPIEQVILSELPLAKTNLKSLVDTVESQFGTQVAQLEVQGFAMDRQQRFRAKLISLVPLALVILLLGLPRLVMGISNNKPVAFLVLTLIAGAIVGAIICLWGTSLRSPRGKHVLEQMRTQHSDSNPHAGLAVALFGTAILTGTALAYINDWYPRQQTTGADGGCGTGCGGGAGCGGGGGGGSGCGGCGGGGGN